MKQFFSRGERIGTSNYYYAKDHLGRIRELTDINGTVQAIYDYDSFGNQTILSQNIPTDFGYVGFHHQIFQGISGSVTLFDRLFALSRPSRYWTGVYSCSRPVKSADTINSEFAQTPLW